MTDATLTGTTVTLTFPLAAAEGLRHAITVVAPQRPTSEREELWQGWGALVNPQPPRATPRPENESRDGMRGLREVASRQASPEPMNVLATLEGAGNFLIAKGATPADVVALHEARAAIAELVEADREFKAANDALSKTHPQGEDAETMESMYAHRNRCRERREKALARVGGGK